MCCLTFSLANVMMQLARGEPLSLEHRTWGTPAMFPFGLRNAAETIGNLTVLCMRSPPTDNEFVGMADYVTESFHDLFARD